MSPQFLSRFDAVVLLSDLTIDELVRIFWRSRIQAIVKLGPISRAMAFTWRSPPELCAALRWLPPPRAVSVQGPSKGSSGA